jgi:acyl-CoA thioesterase-1
MFDGRVSAVTSAFRSGNAWALTVHGPQPVRSGAWRRRVHATVEPFASAWRAANAGAMRAEGPCWVVLGDSMSQGIGARTISGGWVGQLHSTLNRERPQPVRLVNLSTTGARVRDVVDVQLPMLDSLGLSPALVTVLVGANDMFPPRRRPSALADFARLLDKLPPHVAVVGTLPRRNRHALAMNALIDDAAARGTLGVADMRGMTIRSLIGTRAEDHFHPNERGYAGIAERFAGGIAQLKLLD